MSARRPYGVVVRDRPCARCGRGDEFGIAGPGDDVAAMVFENVEEAEHTAALLNNAHEVGYRAAQKECADG